MICLGCQKEFKGKQTAKFCSVNCRVKKCRDKKRNQPKKPDMEKASMTVLINQILDRLDKVEFKPVNQKSYDAPKLSNLTYDEPGQWQKSDILKDYDYYKQKRKDCDNDSDWFELKEEILNSDLPKKEKVLLTQI